MSEVKNIIEKILGIYSLVLIVFGTIGNLLCFIICIRKSLRKTPTFIIMACVSLVDIMSLYFWNLTVFTKIYLGSMLHEINLDWCRANAVAQFICLEASGFLVVCSILLNH